MISLSEQDILQVWETGLRQHPVERALTMLAVALPEVPRSDLIALSVGQRDTYLLDIRERTFGSQFPGYAECPQCQERLEFTFTAADVRVGAAAIEAVGQVQQMFIHGYDLQTRLPDSTDLLAIRGCQSIAAARELLLERCILRSSRNGDEVARESLPQDVIVALGEQLVERDPQAEVRLDLSCPACGHQWSAMFDAVSFMWVEMLTHAKRLLREVHTLAVAYGWRESDILAMSTARRQFYLEMVSR